MNHEMPGMECLEKWLKRWEEATLKGDLHIRWKSFVAVIEVSQAGECHVKVFPLAGLLS